MLRLIGLCISIGFADSLNPSTIAPALLLASGREARKPVAEFTAAVFAVYLLGGLAIALGPGELVLALVPRPGRHLSYVLEIVAGGAMLMAAGLLYGYRHRLASAEVPTPSSSRRGSAWLGATITAVELPTAFPYFAAIAAVVGSGVGVMRIIVLLVVFNLFFIVPLLGILATLTFAGGRAQELLTRWRQRLEANWPTVLAGLALVAGLIVCLLGVTGLAAPHHNDFGTFSRRLRKALSLHP